MEDQPQSSKVISIRESVMKSVVVLRVPTQAGRHGSPVHHLVSAAIGEGVDSSQEFHAFLRCTRLAHAKFPSPSLPDAGHSLIWGAGNVREARNRRLTGAGTHFPTPLWSGASPSWKRWR